MAHVPRASIGDDEVVGLRQVVAEEAAHDAADSGLERVRQPEPADER